MKNVAGLPIEELDQTVERELARVGVPVVRVDVADPALECASHVRGVLGPFTFERAWVHWRVTGPMPLHVAEEFYATPVGRTDIQAGHAGSPQPSAQANHYDAEGSELLPLSDAAEWDALVPKYIPNAKRPVFVDNPAAEAARSEVHSFRVYSELGLYLLVEAIGRHGLALPPLVPDFKPGTMGGPVESCDAFFAEPSAQYHVSGKRLPRVGSGAQRWSAGRHR